MAQPRSFIDQFAERVATAIPAIDERRAAEEAQLQAQANAEVEQLQENQVEREHAREARSDTLDIAWITSALMSMDPDKMRNNPPQTWFDTPDYQKLAQPKVAKALPQPERPKGELLLEGWPILSWTHRNYTDNPTYTLVLTPPTDPNSPNNLVWIKQNKGEYAAQVPLKEEDIHAFTTDPASPGDMPWPNEWPAHKANETVSEGEGYDRGEVRGKPQDVYIRGPLDPTNPDHMQDYQTYNGAGIEARINDALVQFAAENDIFTTKEQMEDILAKRGTNPDPTFPRTDKLRRKLERKSKPEAPAIEAHWGDDPFQLEEYPDPSELGVDEELQPEAEVAPEAPVTPEVPDEPDTPDTPETPDEPKPDEPTPDTPPRPKPHPPKQAARAIPLPALKPIAPIKPKKAEQEPLTSETLFEDMDMIMDTFLSNEAYGLTDTMASGAEISKTYWQPISVEERDQLEALGYKGAQGVKIRRLKSTEFRQPVKAFEISIRMSPTDEVGETLVIGNTDPDYHETKVTENEIQMMFGLENNERDSLYVPKDSKTAKIARELVDYLKRIASNLK